MMKKFICLMVIVGAAFTAISQKYITKSGTIEIFSETSLFTIEAKNTKVASVLNAETGEIVTSTLVRSFNFEEALVEEHFNENYMESHVYPKSLFKGTITNMKEVDLKKDGSYPITVEGELTMHGVTNKITEKGTLEIKDGKVSAHLKFTVSLAAYKIEIEESYKDRIKDEIQLTVEFSYDPYSK